jgi:hypothetical protein
LRDWNGDVVLRHTEKAAGINDGICD